MKTIEETVKEDLGKELNNLFPKGESKSRGSALVFFGGAMLQVRKIIKAFGGCEHCFGKGYATVMVGIRGAEDFGGEAFIESPTNKVSFCVCERGKDLKRLWKSAKTV
jgi:hypothetical protein